MTSKLKPHETRQLLVASGLVVSTSPAQYAPFMKSYKDLEESRKQAIEARKRECKKAGQ